MRILIDGVSFQTASAGIGRIWKSLVKCLAGFDGVRIFMLDRGDAPANVGAELIDFPSYTATYTAADSLLIQHLCNKLEIDVFTSTGYTSATTTPQVQMVYDMIPEVFGHDVSSRTWKEKELCLTYASHFACISKNTRADLLQFYPGIDPSRIAMAYCAADAKIFNAAASLGVREFRETYGLMKPYFLLVGFRELAGNYKNVRVFFDAIKVDNAIDFDVVCVGGERTIDPSWVRKLPPAVAVRRLDLGDMELATAYAGAVALVYPSLYEGFGMPVIEAMASGCPVITTQCGALDEVAGEAALVVSGGDPYEMLHALEQIRRPDVRKQFIAAGLAHVTKFKWERSAEQFFELLLRAELERRGDEATEFHRKWNKFRRAQANVDIGID